MICALQISFLPLDSFRIMLPPSVLQLPPKVTHQIERFRLTCGQEPRDFTSTQREWGVER
jgi:hypothetical protein